MERYTSPSVHLRPGKASDYIDPFNIRPGDRVLLACRVSAGAQKRNGNFDDQVGNLKAAIAAAGGEVIAWYGIVQSGFDPSWVATLAAMAKSVGAIIVAESTDRLVRHPAYHSTRCPDAQAGTWELEELQYWLDGVPAQTLLHPDAEAAMVRSYQRQRGQRLKGREGGRPVATPAGGKLHARLLWLPYVLGMHRAGASVRDIAKALKIPKTTCQRWISNHG